MDTKSNITRRRLLLAGGATTVFGGGIAYLASRSGSGGPTYVPASSHSSEETTGFGVDLAGRPIAGDPDAPVDIYYWTDYLCPFCKKFETETLPDVGEDYLDTGTARLVVLSYPNIGEYSVPAAVWGRCVWSQVADDNPEAFWRWHEAAFDEQAESGKEWADAETFRGVTERTEGVAASEVETCRQNRGEAIRASIEPNLEIAQSSGIRGTPGFVFYNRESGAAGKLVGAHPYENFANAIERIRNA
jgi:protein-disulfide isomerase